MSRDLLYKPPTPLVLPEDQDDGKPRVQPTDKAGLPRRGRDLGGTPDDVKRKAPADPAAPSKQDAVTETPVEPARGPAYKAEYFTKDVESTAGVNLRARPMQALRGAEGASDLKKVVLPAGEVQTPDPGHLRQASDLMGLGGSPDLSTLLARQGGWARAKNVTVESLQARMAELQSMVQARMAALARMTHLPHDRLSRSVTLAHATVSQGAALENAEDVVEIGNALARDTADQAKGMHKRIAKTLGIKSDKDDASK